MNLHTGVGGWPQQAGVKKKESTMADGMLTIEERKARLMDQLENSNLSEAEVGLIERKLDILNKHQG